MSQPPSVASSRVRGRAPSWMSTWSVTVRLPWATSGNTSSSLQAREGTGFWELVVTGSQLWVMSSKEVL